MTGQPLDLDAIEARYSDHLARHSHMGSFACCSAHASADDVPALVAAVRRLTAKLATMTAVAESNKRYVQSMHQDLQQAQQQAAAIAIADDQRRTCPTHGYLAPQFDPSTCTCPPGD